MKLLGKLAGASAALALIGMAVPANAQAWGSRYYHGYRGDGGGGIIAALLAGGILGAVVASAASRPHDTIVVDHDAPPPEDVDAPPPPPEGAAPPPNAGPDDEESATYACASAAEEEGSHYARIAQVDHVASVSKNGGDWVVTGNLRLSADLRDASRSYRDFRCTLHPDGSRQVTVLGAPA